MAYKSSFINNTVKSCIVLANANHMMKTNVTRNEK